MNTAWVRISVLRRSGGTSQEPLDRAFQEATGPAQRNDNELVLKAQVYIAQHQKNVAIFGGDTKPTAGRLTFETKYLNDQLKAAGLTELRNGDMITGLSRTRDGDVQVVDYLVDEAKPTAWLRGVPITTTVTFINNENTEGGTRMAR